MRNAKIIASGMFVPEKIVPNSYFNELLGENVSDWLEENVEIHERRWCSDDDSTADLCTNAANDALKNANLNADELDLIIVATDTPEYISPSTSTVVQHRIDAKNAGTFDLNSACAGFVTALDTGAKYIRADKKYKHVMVIGAYAMSKHLNMEDKNTVSLFADGAAAFILKAEESEEQGFLAGNLKTQGQFADWMGIFAGGTKFQINPDSLGKKLNKLQFVKRFPSDLNPTIWSEMIKELCDEIGVNPKDINHFFISQLNIRALQQTMDLLDLDMSRTPTIMHTYGYTGSACIPMAFHLTNKEGKIKKDDLVLFVGSGGGLSFAASVFKM
ncbi:3-oxoacyl-ACP synthase III family protein [Yeosuana sp.]|uniref:3-oxoacyl-ACP synthase III family protein n=1 Tax=Yeosuana sp. TaxID=2529388 RepID=UPI004054BB84